MKKDDKFCYACGASAAKIVKEEFAVSADNLIEKVKELLHEGNLTRIIVKDEQGKTMLEIPATIGVIAALATNCKIVVERRE